MNMWNLILFILSIFPLMLTIYFFSEFSSQGRKNWKKINLLVAILTLISFAYSCWQVSYFFDESYYLLLNFPTSYFSHTYLFLVPAFLTLLALPKLYIGLSKLIKISLLGFLVLSVLALVTFPGKDLIWFSISLSTLFVFIGLKEEQFGLYYKYFVKYLFLENTWVALFYFKDESLFAFGLILQTAARLYFFNFLRLFWVQGFLKTNQESKPILENLVKGGLLKE